MVAPLVGFVNWITILKSLIRHSSSPLLVFGGQPVNLLISRIRSMKARLHVTIFSKIINREIEADIAYEDDLCLAFHDVNPQAPVHVLLIPKKPIESLDSFDESDAALAGHLLAKVPEVAAKLGLSNGYRTVINTGQDGGQTVIHLHIHILGGRSLTWPPG